MFFDGEHVLQSNLFSNLIKLIATMRNATLQRFNVMLQVFFSVLPYSVHWYRSNKTQLGSVLLLEERHTALPVALGLLFCWELCLFLLFPCYYKSTDISVANFVQQAFRIMLRQYSGENASRKKKKTHTEEIGKDSFYII